MAGSCGSGRCPSGYTGAVRCVLGLRCTDKLIAYTSTSLPYSAAQCYWLAGGCQGTGIGTPYVNNCYPYAVWSSTAVEPIGHYRGYEMYGGSFFYSSGTCGAGVYGKCGTTWGFSVRCVLGLRWSSAAHTPVCSCATTM